MEVYSARVGSRRSSETMRTSAADKQSPDAGSSVLTDDGYGGLRHNDNVVQADVEHGRVRIVFDSGSTTTCHPLLIVSKLANRKYLKSR